MNLRLYLIAKKQIMKELKDGKTSIMEANNKLREIEDERTKSKEEKRKYRMETTAMVMENVKGVLPAMGQFVGNLISNIKIKKE